MAAPKQKKPRLPVMLDIETLSLDRHAAVIDIAVAPIDGTNQGKRWLVTPSSYNNHQNFLRDPETVAFHSNNKSGIMEDAEAVGHSWQKVADEVYQYFYDLSCHYEVHPWSQGKDFDFPILEHLFKQAGLKTPWKYSHTHCLRDLSGLYPEVKRAWYGNHTAMQDVRAQVAHIQAIAARDDRAYRFIFGEGDRE